MALNFFLQSKSNSIDYNLCQICGLKIYGKLNIAIMFCNDLVFSITILVKFHGLTFMESSILLYFCFVWPYICKCCVVNVVNQWPWYFYCNPNQIPLTNNSWKTQCYFIVLSWPYIFYYNPNQIPWTTN